MLALMIHLIIVIAKHVICLLPSVGVEEVALTRRVERQVHRRNHPGDTAEEYFKINIMYPILKNITYQLETLFDKKAEFVLSFWLLLLKFLPVTSFFSASEVASMLTVECHLPCPVQL